jgi:predicted membrane protein
LGVVLAVIAVVVFVLPMPVGLTAGNRIHTVTEMAELESSYRLGVGTLTLDLRDLELVEGTTELTASVSMGELVVRVPAEVTVTGTGHTLAGEIDAFGRTTAGSVPGAM